MKKIITFLLVICSMQAGAEMLWKPDAITFELKQSHKALGLGLVLEINQALALGESGWKQSRIDLPENWVDAELKMKQGSIYLNIDGQSYYINAENKGALSFAILNGGKKTDEQLLEIWSKHAKST
ncbi:MAG: hypothetical protein AAF431_04770 [Pseudomonadota bacterium]